MAISCLINWYKNYQDAAPAILNHFNQISDLVVSI